MNISYYSYLSENYPEKAKYLEWMKYELDNRVYYFGQNFKNPFEGRPTKQRINIRLAKLKRQLLGKKNTVISGYKDCILSEAYFTVNDVMSEKLKAKVLRFPWNEGADVFSSIDTYDTLQKLSSADFNELISDEFCSRLEKLYEAIKSFLAQNNIRLCIFPNDLVPVNRIAIDACREVGVPTSIFLHGLPARYDIIDDNRADYLCVWGESIKKQYENVGVSPEKILITGHPSYSTIEYSKPKEISFDAPLVLSYSVCGAPSTSDEYRMADRGISVNFPWLVEKVLKEIGVKHAILRLHPSENPDWYRKYIDNDFYKIDTHTLSESLKAASIVIGPTSTVSMDAAIAGVSYFAFEPPMQFAYPVVPPFDNSEPDFPVAFTVKELSYNLRNKRSMQPSVFKRYIASEFNMQLLLDKIK